MDEIRNLYFQRSNGEHRLLATDVTEDEAYKEMQKFILVVGNRTVSSGTMLEAGANFLNGLIMN